MALGNCDSDWRSAQSNIQLVALCKQDFEHTQFYGPLVNGLRQIESAGIEIWPGKTVKGSLTFIAGDNLGSNGIGGFTENFSTSEFFCRFCLIPRQLFGANEQFRFAPRRTVNNYNEALARLEEERNNGAGEKKDFQGVKFDYLFNTLESFHSVRGLPCCVAHDLEEGAFAFDGALAIKGLIHLKWFTLDELNESITTQKYTSKDKRDKPVVFPKAFTKIPGSASQVRAFIRLFPLLLSGKITDPTDEVWQFLLLLREINLLCFTPVVRKSSLPYLEMQILEYLDMRATLFKEIPLRPKHHFLQHHAELISQFGPLPKVST